jgi:hypothetical protein
MASLEGLTPQQIKDLAGGMTALLNSTDPDTRLGVQRMLKKVDPNLSFPELVQADAISAAVTEVKKTAEELRQEQAQRDFRANTEREHEQIRARGYKVEDVQKFMTERGIVKFDTALQVLDMQSTLAAPTPEALAQHGNYDMPEDQKEIFKNPAGWARKTAHALIDQLKGRKASA